ncbi:MAG TPA: hypothetical protein VML75_03175 [Kofleriaceae bacterium]|nr:hypothetical protein [Kofleriaceae bacterium]
MESNWSPLPPCVIAAVNAWLALDRAPLGRPPLLGSLVEIAQANDVCGTQLASFLFDCAPTQLAPQPAWDITNYASSAVLEGVLQCAASDRFEGLRDRFPDIVEYKHAP